MERAAAMMAPLAVAGSSVSVRRIVGVLCRNAPASHGLSAKAGPHLAEVGGGNRKRTCPVTPIAICLTLSSGLPSGRQAETFFMSTTQTTLSPSSRPTITHTLVGDLTCHLCGTTAGTVESEQPTLPR